MALSAGLVVANLYYCQPLIPLIADSFNISAEEAGRITWITQAGYALGLFFIVPLGDVIEKKRQILACTFATSFFMLLASASSTFSMLAVCCFLVGLTSIVPQLILPFAATLSSEEQRGRAIGIVMSGLLVGILASRALSGAVGAFLGWRATFLLGAGACMSVMAGLYFLLPQSKPVQVIPYRLLMKSVIHYFNSVPQLRIASVINALSFSVVSSFWVVMVLYLSEVPFHFNAWQIGLFGLAGAAGALAAPVTGRLSSAGNGNTFILAGLLFELASFAVFVFMGSSMALLIAGIFLLDIGHQMIQIINQLRIYSIKPEARNRFNTAFMTTYFLGGTGGAALGISLWNAGGWSVYCAGCATIVLVNFLVYYISRRAA